MQENQEAIKPTPEELLNLEKNEIDSVLDAGIEIQIGRRKYTLTQFYGGTNIHLCREFIKLEMQSADPENRMPIFNRFVMENSRTWANIIAIAVLNSKWKIRLFKKRLANKLLWQYKNSDLEEIVQVIAKMSNYTDFIISSRSIAGMRMTKPNLEEEKPQA